MASISEMSNIQEILPPEIIGKITNHLPIHTYVDINQSRRINRLLVW